MAARVTIAEVKVVIGTTLTDPVIQVWIDASNTVVNQAADCINGDEALLKQIELFLSSHFVALIDPDSDASNSQIKSEKIESVSFTYATAELSRNINDTPYGQTANFLSNGCLIKSGLEKATVEFF